jgi:hypothetical protein
LTAAGVLSVLAFAVLAGRFWHPYYGFTRFVQLDQGVFRNSIPALQEHPVFVYEEFDAYDGAAYTQIAFHPLLDAPELPRAVGNVPYRARRILGSALAWLLAGGDPARIAPVYAGLNLAVWLVLAALLWRVLPVKDARSWMAWAGVMFSAGALHSVRLALTDLLAATLVTAAIALSERGRSAGAMSSLAAAGLARETALAAVVGLWRGPWKSGRAWTANIIRAAIVFAPLLLWVAYIRWKVGSADQGFGNFTWPVIGWIEKWSDTFADYARHPNFRWLNTTTLLALIAMTVQAGFLLSRWRRADPWWRVGVTGIAMMVLLGTSVWEGHPGAATRVLLPMGVAFAVCAVRERASAKWLILGGLTVFSGVMALWHVPQDPRELATGKYGQGAYLVRLDTGWFGTERKGDRTWAWSSREGRLAIETSPRSLAPLKMRLRVRSIAPRQLQIRSAGNLLWRGTVGPKLEWIEVSAAPQMPGKLSIDLLSDDPPVRESEDPDARMLAFAVYGVELR